jgi:hypothetical protein
MNTQRQQDATMDAFEQEYLAWYARAHDTVGQPFDPRVFVGLARVQWSDMPQLADAFARCTASWYESAEQLYTHFLSPQARRQRGDYAGSRLLEHPSLGTLAVLVYHDAQAPEGLSLGGMEYLDRVWRMAHEEKRELYWPAGDAVPTSAAPPRSVLRIVHVDRSAQARPAHERMSDGAKFGNSSNARR